VKRGTRGMGRVFQRGGVWWIAYYYGGTERRESSRSTRRPVAVALLKRRHQELAQGRPASEAAKVLLSDLKGLIVADYSLNGRRSAKRLGQSWAHLAGFFGATEKAIAITATRLASYVTTRSEEGAAPATIKNELAALKRAFNLARKTGTLLAHEMPAAFPTITPTNARSGFFERGEHDAVRAALPRDEGDVAEFLFWSGWRKQEALQLRWADVDRGAQVIRIEKTKNGTARTLPYGALPALLELIDARHKHREEIQEKRGMVVSRVFNRNGEPIRYFRRAWISACIAAGLGVVVKDDDGNVIERRALRIPHDYRRSAARNLSRAGVPERVIMAVCGWKTRSVFDRYNIVNEADISAGLARLAAAPPVSQAPKVASIENTDKRRTDVTARSARGRRKSLGGLVAWDGIEPPTRGFSEPADPSVTIPHKRKPA
jgi:integrase